MTAEPYDHGEFQYTLRQYLLMRRLQLGGDWTDVVADVGRELRYNPEWDVEELASYDEWRDWYYGSREVA